MSALGDDGRPARVGPPGEWGECARLAPQQARRVVDRAAVSLSAATRAAYRSDADRWQAWCRSRGVLAWPADPALVTLYVQQHADLAGPDGCPVYAAATLARWVSCLNWVNRALGAIPPGQTRQVRDVLAGVRDDRGSPARPRRREPLLQEDLARLVIAIEGSAGSWAQRVAARRDVALLTAGWAGAFRRWELARLQLCDITYHPGDGLQVRLVRSPTGPGEQITGLPFGTRRETCPVCAVLAWVQVVAAWDEGGRTGVLRVLRQPEPTGHVCRLGWAVPASTEPVFRSVHRTGVLGGALSGPAINVMFRRRARAVGFDPAVLCDVGGRSLGAGLVTAVRPGGTGAEHRPPDGARIAGGGRSPAGARPAGSRRGDPGPDGRYAREWARFVDWCAATGRTPLPATSDDVLAYLVDEHPTGGTAARWVAAIQAAHRPTGTDPCAGAPAAWVRQARGGSRGPAPAAMVSVLRDVPTTGWPVGVFGRRDRLAFLLHRVGGLPVRVLVGLRVADLSMPASRCLQVNARAAGTISVPAPDADPVACPACAAVSWLEVLHHEVTCGWRALATLMSQVEPDSGHVCEQRRYDPAAGLVGWPVFPAINRWGHLPLPPAPGMSQRALGEVLRRLQAGVSTHATVPFRVPVTRQEPQDLQPPLAAPAPPPARATWHRDGVAARQRAQASLDEVTGRIDELVTGIAEWEAKVEQVMQTAIVGDTEGG